MLMTAANAFGNVPDQNTISPQDAIFSLCDTVIKNTISTIVITFYGNYSLS